MLTQHMLRCDYAIDAFRYAADDATLAYAVAIITLILFYAFADLLMPADIIIFDAAMLPLRLFAIFRCRQLLQMLPR